MAYVGDTGQGATLSLPTTGAIGCVRTLQLPSFSMQKIDASCLDTTGFMRYIPGDLTDPGELVVTAVFDATNTLPVNGVIETAVVTLPIGTSGNTTAATLTGSGFVYVHVLPSLSINNLMELQLTFAFDGDTGPTWSEEAA